jgi:threonine synthase
LAFKDYAMQILGRLFDQALLARGKRTTIVGATSGDTGSAAIEACKDREAIDVFIFFPKDRVSPIQQRQMTTVEADNIHAIALEGTFDDCQDMVKALFNNLEFRDKYALSAINSINWARLMPQIVYYVFSAYAAKKMGLPIEKLIVATNSNDILTRFFNTGTMEIRGVQPSISPSMDIQVSSNFERLLFDLNLRDGASTNKILEIFRSEGKFSVPEETLMEARRLFDAVSVSDMDTLGRISTTYKEKGEILDPHTAIGVEGAYRFASSASMESDLSIVSLACAHPAKFPDAVQKATGASPELPVHLKDLLTRKERLTVLPNSIQKVSNYIAANSRIEVT